MNTAERYVDRSFNLILLAVDKRAFGALSYGRRCGSRRLDPYRGREGATVRCRREGKGCTVPAKRVLWRHLISKCFNGTQRR